jgi:hypothetical protein
MYVYADKPSLKGLQMPRKATGKPDGRPPKGPRSGLSERINTRCTPEVKAAIKREMARTGMSEGQLVEMVLRHHLMGDEGANAVGALITQLVQYLGGPLGQDLTNEGWFYDPHKHLCLTVAINKLLNRFKPEGEPIPLPELMTQLEEFNIEAFAEPETAGGMAVGSIAKEWEAVEPDYNRAFNDLASIKAILIRDEKRGKYL